MYKLWYLFEYHVKKNIQMNDIGSRIKEERTRLGLSQEAFGKLGGVKKLAQLNYEKGSRSPTGIYFDNLRQHKAIDTTYILTGMKEGPELDDALAHRLVLVFMCIQLGIEMDDLGRVCDLALLNQKKSRLGEDVDPSEVADAVSNLIAICDRTARINVTLLTDILNKVEIVIEASKCKLSSTKRSQVIAMLYRVFSANDQADQKIIEETVLIASE